jgi:hypothetical protein
VNNPLSSRPKYLNVYELARKKLEEGLSYTEVDNFLFRATDKVWEGLVLSVELDKYVKASGVGKKDLQDLSFNGARNILKQLIAQREYQGNISENLQGKDLAKVYFNRVAYFKEQHKKYKKIVQEINRVHKLYLNAIETVPFNISSLVVTNQKIQFIIGTYKPIDIQWLFDSLEPSPTVKNIIMSGPNGIYQSLYHPGLTGKPVSQKDLINSTSQFAMNTITFTVDTDAIYTLVYKLDAGCIQTELKSSSTQSILDVLIELFGTVTVNVIEVQCQMNFYPTSPKRFDFREYYFLHRIVQFPEVYQCYLDESILAYPDKNEYKFRYKPYWTPDSLKYAKVPGMKNESFFYIGVSNQLDSNSYFTFHITSISLDSVYRLLTFLVPAICYYYTEDLAQESTLAGLYNIPGIDEYAASKRPIGKVKKSEARRQLHDQWPEVFSEEYIKTKSVKSSEVIAATISHLEVENWKRQNVMHKGVSYTRTVLPFPKKGPRLFWFTFLTPPNQYPGYLLNTYDKEPRYKYIPACFSSKHRRKDQLGMGSGTVKSLKIRGVGQNGMMPRDTLDTILNFPVERAGTGIGPNSFLDAVALCLDIRIPGKILRKILTLGCKTFETEVEMIRGIKHLDKASIASVLDVDENLEVVKEVLKLGRGSPQALESLLITSDGLHRARVKSIINKSKQDIKLGKYKDRVYKRIGWEIYKQQLYDLSRSEIELYLEAKDKYFDPLLFISGVEELFDIEIFMIVPTDKDSIITHEIVLPRHSHFHCRSNLLRKCVIIYKNPGKQSDRLPYPNCEIIKPEGGSPKLYGIKVTEVLYKILAECNEVTIVRGEGETYEPTYLKSQFYKILRRVTILSQYVDSRGKCRAVTVAWNDEIFSIFCSPMAPLNCPIVRQLLNCSVATGVKLCGDGSGDDDPILGCSNMGVWLKDSESNEIIYVRVDEEIDSDIANIGTDPISDTRIQEPVGKTSNAIFATKRDRMALIIREYMKWFFEIFMTENLKVPGYHLELFIDKYMGFTDMDVDEDDWYSIEGVEEIIPAVNSTEEAYNLVKLIIPTSAANGKLVFHNRKYYTCIIYTIQKHVKTFISKADRESKSKRYIPGYYKSLYDFHKRPNEIILTGISNPLTTIVNASNKYTVVTELHSDMFVNKDPMLFYDGIGYYIIQPTRVNAFRTAYTLCYGWWKYGINLGYGVKELDDVPKVKVVIYEIKLGLLSPIDLIKKKKVLGDYMSPDDTPNERMVPRDYLDREDEAPDTDEFFEIILVNKIRYIALLRLS